MAAPRGAAFVCSRDHLCIELTSTYVRIFQYDILKTSATPLLFQIFFLRDSKSSSTIIAYFCCPMLLKNVTRISNILLNPLKNGDMLTNDNIFFLEAVRITCR